MSDSPKNKIVLNRMNYVLGHVKATIKMLEEKRYCVDVIRQNQAVISALKKINEIILENHLDTCVTSAVRGKSEAKKRKVYNEIVQIFTEKQR
jgi:DNA-binding FrmR family transcriptional regulator